MIPKGIREEPWILLAFALLQGQRFITVDMSRCIECARCVRICDEVQDSSYGTSAIVVQRTALEWASTSGVSAWRANGRSRFERVRPRES